MNNLESIKAYLSNLHPDLSPNGPRLYHIQDQPADLLPFPCLAPPAKSHCPSLALRINEEFNKIMQNSSKQSPKQPSTPNISKTDSRKQPSTPNISKTDSRKRKTACLMAAKKSSIPSVPKPSYLINSMPVSPVEEMMREPKDSLFHAMNNYNKLTLPNQQLLKSMPKPITPKSDLTRSIPVPRQSDLMHFLQERSNPSVPEREVIDLVSDDEIYEVFPTIEEEKKMSQTGRQPNTPQSTHLQPRTHSRAETPQLPTKRPREEIQESTFCIVCKWKFPVSFNILNKQVHINKCIEGHGREDIIEYRKSEKFIRQIQKRNTTECPESDIPTLLKRRNCLGCNKIMSEIPESDIPTLLKVRRCLGCNKIMTECPEEFSKDCMNQGEGGSHISISSDSSHCSSSRSIPKPKIISFDQCKKLLKVKEFL